MLCERVPVITLDQETIDVNHGVLESPFSEIGHFIWRAAARIGTIRDNSRSLSGLGHVHEISPYRAQLLGRM